ncbi:MAG: AAA family ATPase [Chloroflexi bacterium]|nr:AAA family ATPase [Chloroflexota bacterium]MCL5076353.1 AAA family ATPase [Chloroflexota bacterium]
MIKNLEVKNFKSIKYLKLDCKRVNIFIGKPNTGKSNILESMGIFSLPYGNLSNLVRFENNMINLFYDQDLTEKIEIKADDVHFDTTFMKGQFNGNCGDKEHKYFGGYFNFFFDYEGRGYLSRSATLVLPFKFYRFEVINIFPGQEFEFLLPPRGDNLLSILQTNKALKKVVADIFKEYGLRIVFKPHEGKIEAQKEVEDVIISYPYSLVSDTLQRIVFYLAAIETNQNSIIMFEEPEAHAFPYYTKFLAERIALDRTNQYFISTHNPYFLLSVLEKTPKDEIGIFITYLKDYQTRVRPISEREMPEILDQDASIFFNLDQFLEER